MNQDWPDWLVLWGAFLLALGFVLVTVRFLVVI